MGFEFVICRSSGEPVGAAITAVGPRKLSLRLNGVHSATVPLRLAAPDGLGSETPDELAQVVVLRDPARLKVWRDYSDAEVAANPALIGQRQLVFYGSLPPDATQEKARANQVEAVFQDPRWVLAARFSAPTTADDQYVATDQGLILWGLVNTQNLRAGGDTWIRQGGVTTGITRDRAYDRRAVLDLFQEMTEVIDGPDVDVDPRDGFAEVPSTRIMGNLRVYNEQGTDRSASVVFAYGMGMADNLEDVERSFQSITTLATITGTPSGSATPLSSTFGAPASSLYGLLEDYVSDNDVSVQATLDAKARGIVDEQQAPREVLSLGNPTSEAPQPFEHYGLGDRVRVVARKGALNVDRVVRVHGIDIEIDQNGRQTVSLTTAGVV